MPPFNTHPQKSTAGARFSRASLGRRCLSPLLLAIDLSWETRRNNFEEIVSTRSRRVLLYWKL